MKKPMRHHALYENASLAQRYTNENFTCLTIYLRPDTFETFYSLRCAVPYFHSGYLCLPVHCQFQDYTSRAQG